GAECAVLEEIEAKLTLIRAVTLEYHQNPRNLAQRRLESILKILDKAEFSCDLFYKADPIRFHDLPKDPVYQLIVRATKRTT
ncbi:MAG TPA: hypothetical protein VIT23_03240, partial [Terrimicrobiaceae bacterium]